MRRRLVICSVTVAVVGLLGARRIYVRAVRIVIVDG
jgi:hypothetical protein